MEKKKNASQLARRTASMGLLLALALVLNMVEGMLPALPAMPPGVRLGLSNIVVLYCVLYLGRKDAFVIAVLTTLSTVFIKQHSFLDVIWGVIWCVPIYLITQVWMKRRMQRKEEKRAQREADKSEEEKLKI